MRRTPEQSHTIDTLSAQWPRPRRRDDLLCHEIDGESVLYDRVTDSTIRLNATACFIWRACDGGNSVNAIADRLTSTFDVDPATAARDVRSTIRELHSSGLLSEPLAKGRGEQPQPIPADEFTTNDQRNPRQT